MNLKQVIVLRKDLNMRKGKMVAQGSHASVQVFMHVMHTNPSHAMYWYNSLSTKICVGVDSEKELMDVYLEAQKLQLPCSLIKDAGLTEFKEPTYTAVAIGPADAAVIDSITGTKKLL